MSAVDLPAAWVPLGGDPPASVRGANLRAVYVIWYRDVLRYRRDRVRLLSSLAQPLLFLFVFGVGLNASLHRFGASGTAKGSGNYLHFMYPGVVGLAVLTTAVFSAMSIVYDREFGFLKEILIAPVDRSAIAIGKALGGSTQAVMQGIIMLLFVPLIGIHFGIVDVLKVIPILFVLAFSLASFGIAVASRIKSTQAFQGFTTLVLMPMFFLSAALYSPRSLPGWMGFITRLDPITYGVSALRQVLLSSETSTMGAANVHALTLFGAPVSVVTALALLLSFGGVMLLLAIRGLRSP